MLKPFFSTVAVLLVGGLATAAVLTVVDPSTGVELPPPIERDLGAILERDTLIALTSYNSTSYFVYRGETLGYEYELLKDFAEDEGVVFKMKVVPRDSLFYYLNAGEGDIAAARIQPFQEDTLAFGFTVDLYETRPVIVQQEAPFDSATAPAGVDDLLEKVPHEIAEERQAAGADDERPFRPVRIRARRIRRPADLAGESVYVPEEDPYIDRLVEIRDRISGDINVVEVDTSSESLIRQVAVGNIELTVAQENVARLEESYFRNLLVQPVIGAPHGVAWGVRSNAPVLRQALDAWILKHRDSARWRQLYRRYFIDREGYRERVETGFLTGDTGALSAYDRLLKRYAPTIGWDWRLLASQMFQESRFNPRATSWAGAMGLLQLMPATAREIGVTQPFDPEDNVAGAVRYLAWLDKYYWRDEIADPRERVKFILASYNAGTGHVMDARRLALARGDDPNTWSDVAFWLLQLSKEQVYNLPAVRHGYCRGLEPVQYVARILDRYENYRQFVSGIEGAAAYPSQELGS